MDSANPAPMYAFNSISPRKVGIEGMNNNEYSTISN